jgi:hypothetical protein
MQPRHSGAWGCWERLEMNVAARLKDRAIPNVYSRDVQCRRRSSPAGKKFVCEEPKAHLQVLESRFWILEFESFYRVPGLLYLTLLQSTSRLVSLKAGTKGRFLEE